jgi:hypothetical protein
MLCQDDFGYIQNGGRKPADNYPCVCPPAGDKWTFNKAHEPTTRVQQIPGVGLT